MKSTAVVMNGLASSDQSDPADETPRHRIVRTGVVSRSRLRGEHTLLFVLIAEDRTGLLAFILDRIVAFDSSASVDDVRVQQLDGQNEVTVSLVCRRRAEAGESRDERRARSKALLAGLEPRLADLDGTDPPGRRFGVRDRVRMAVHVRGGNSTQSLLWQAANIEKAGANIAKLHARHFADTVLYTYELEFPADAGAILPGLATAIPLRGPHASVAFGEQADTWNREHLGCPVW